MLHLSEHTRSQPVSLTLEQQAVLSKDFQALFEPAAEGRVFVTPRDRVGIVTVGDLQISVRPKFPIRRLLQMLAEAADPYRWLDLDVSSIAETSLHDAVAALFARSCLQTFQRGVLRSYHREQQNLAYVRGRIRIQQYLQAPQPVPIPVTADLFDDDVLENQVLRAALTYLRSLPGLSPSTRSEVLRALRTVDHVQPLREPLRALRGLAWTRQNFHYRSILTLAELILAGGSLSDGASSISHSGFVIDMPRMVEQWVRSQLRTAWGLSPAQMRDSWGGQLWLDGAHRVELIPDLAVRSAGEWQFVGDVKYKALRSDGAHRDDVYQMLAYLTGTGLQEGVLIYVGIDGPNETLVLPQNRQRIQVVSINLDSDSASRTLQQYARNSASGAPQTAVLSTTPSRLSDG